MPRTNDNWERLVDATLKREQFRQLAFAPSRESSFSSVQSDNFFDSPLRSHYADGSSDASPYVKAFSFDELKKATRNFRPEGEAFDRFKGWIDEDTLTATKPGSGFAITVMKFTPKGVQGHEEWVTYVNHISQLHHTNLVKIIGYCTEADNRLLVFEFMPRESLGDRLFTRRFPPLSWAARMKVAIGVARGLCFLHEAEEQVIHGDFQPSNILLDEEFNVKLFAFSLNTEGPECSRFAHLLRFDRVPMSRLNYRAKSSGFSYIYDDDIYHDVPIGQSCVASKHLDKGKLSAECDVYGFGVLLLELLSGRRAFDMRRTVMEQYLVPWAKPHLGDKRILFRIIMDSKLEGLYSKKAAIRVACLSLECLSDLPDRRPRMADVLAKLEELCLSMSKWLRKAGRFTTRHNLPLGSSTF